MSSGPKAPGRFGAVYCNLKYYEQWNALWRVEGHPDVLVRFDQSPVRFVENPRSQKEGVPEELTIQRNNFPSNHDPLIVYEPGNRMYYATDPPSAATIGPGLATIGRSVRPAATAARCTRPIAPRISSDSF